MAVVGFLLVASGGVMSWTRGHLRPTMIALASSSSASASAARGANRSSFTCGGINRLQVTEFFAALFPTYFPSLEAASVTTSHAVSQLMHASHRRELSDADVSGPVVGRWGGAASQDTALDSVRSWHVMTNLKHAMLHVSNGEERTVTDRNGRNSGGAQGELANHCPGRADSDCEAHAWNSIDKCRGTDYIYSGGRTHAKRSNIVHLVRDTVRFIEQYRKRASTETSASSDAALPKAMESDKGHNATVSCNRSVLQSSDEVLLAYVADGYDDVKGEAQQKMEPLRCALDQTLRLSSYMFHLAFEMLVRQGQSRMAVELFRRWWKHNPHLFPIELEVHQEDALALMLRDMRREKSDDNDSTATVQWDMIARRLALVPYKKYLVSSALFSRVLMVALCLRDPLLEDRFVMQELLYNGIFMTVCGGVNSGASDSSTGDLRFHLFKEKYEDWLVLVGAVAAAAMLKRHMEDFLRVAHSEASYSRLVSTVTEEYLTFIVKACGMRDHRTFMNDASMESSKAPGWAKLLFTTVLRCYEESGVFHVSPARRPGTSAPLWQQIHKRLLLNFPHVFHAGNTVTTLLSFAALEEAAVSSLGAYRISFFGKEEGLRRWRLECLLRRTTETKSKDGEATWSHFLGEQPRLSRRLQARFVTAHSCPSSIEDGKSAAKTEDEVASTAHAPRPLHRKHRNMFGSAFSASASQPSVPVFLTAEEVNQCAANTFDEIEAARRSAVTIFRDHTSLPMLCPAIPVTASDPREKRTRDDIVAEASQPSVFLFLRLVSFLASMGEPPRVVKKGASVKRGGDDEEERGGNTAHRFPLLHCLEKDILPFCQPSVAAYLRRCCATYLSRSSIEGIRVLLTEYQSLLQELTEETVVERVIAGLLWAGVCEDEMPSPSSSSSSEFLVGSGSLAWQVVAQHHALLFSGSNISMLEMILSHLVILSIAIPDDYRRIICVSPYMHLLSHKVEDGEATALSDLHDELRWNPPSAVHLYISLFELLFWVAEAKRKQTPIISTDCSVDDNHGDGEDRDSGESPCAGGKRTPTLSETAHHWSVAQRFLRSRSSISVPLPPSILERISLILVHSCPDVEMLLLCMLSLSQKQNGRDGAKTRSSGMASMVLEEEAVSFVTPRLLTSLCGLLVMNGVDGCSVRQWRQMNGAPFGGCDTLREWHHKRFGCMIPVTIATNMEGGAEDDGGSVGARNSNDDAYLPAMSATSAAAHLLGSVVLDILLSDVTWYSLCRDNYYVSLFVSSAGHLEDTVTREKKMTPLTLGVVLPSRQLSSAYPVGVRQRVTNLKDTIRAMSAEQRMLIRHSLSLPLSSLTCGNAMLATHSLDTAIADDGTEEEGDAFAGVLRLFDKHEL